MMEFKNIDVILGDHKKRYFGDGLKNTIYKEIKKVDDRKNVYSASVTHEGMWSEKNKKTVKHLSTVDAVIIAARTFELFYKNNCSDNLTMVLFEIKAPNKPITELDDLKVEITEFNEKNIEVDCKINLCGMKIKLMFIKSKKKPNLGIYSFYENILKESSANIENLHLKNKENIMAKVTFANNQKIKYSGFESTNYTISLLQWLPVFSQLTQALAYSYDGIKREDSENMWMRKIKLCNVSRYSNGSDVKVKTTINDAKLATLGNKTYRMLDLCGECDNKDIVFKASIAHIIKEDNNG